MIWQDAATSAGSGGSGLFVGGFSWGTLLLVVGMFLSLAVVSALGILARMRERAVDRKARRPPVPREQRALDDPDGATPAG